MQIKIGDTIYTAEKQPIMVILTPQDKINIACMRKDATKYCEFNDKTISFEEVDEWMGEGLPAEEMIGNGCK